MTNRESPEFQLYVKLFFAEIMQNGGHYPPLKARLRGHFNRFELEDLSELFATLACEQAEKQSVSEDVISDPEDEKSEDYPQQSGEEVCPPVLEEAQEPSPELVDHDSEVDRGESP